MRGFIVGFRGWRASEEEFLGPKAFAGSEDEEEG